MPGAQTVNEDTALVFHTIAVSDVDANGGSEKVTLSVNHGSLSLFTVAGLNFTVGDGTGDATMTFTGTIAAINAALNGLTYQGASNYNGSDTLTITTNDQGNTGTGGSLSDTDTIAITVNAVNDAPTAVADVGAVTEGATLSKTAATGVIQGGLGADSDVDNTTASLVVSGAVAGVGAVTQGLGVGSSLAGTYGHLTLAANGSYIYVADQPAADALAAGVTATDVFTYAVKDPGNLVSNTATLTITVTGTNDAPVVSGVSVDDTGHISFSIADPDNSSFTLVNTPAGVAAAFGNPTLSLGSNILAMPTEQATTSLSGTLQISDGAGGTDDVIGLYLGTSVGDTITLPIPGSLNAVYSFGGNDTINLAVGDFTTGTYIDGGTGTDTINLTTTGSGQSIDFTVGTIENIENLIAVNRGNGNGWNQTFTVTAAQWAGLSSIDMNDGSSDTLNIRVSGAVDISSSGAATITDTEAVHVIGTGSADSLTLTGAQLNNLIGTGADINLGNGTDTINLTSTSTGLNGLSDGELNNVEVISASTTSSGVKINLSAQTEGFTIIGGSGADILVGGTGADTLTGNGGADQFRLRMNGSSDVITDYAVGTDKIALLDTGSTSTSTGSVNFLNTTGTQLGATLAAADFQVRTSISNINSADDNHVILISGAQSAAQIAATTSSATNSYVVVFNSTSGHGEIWFDTDWSNAGNRELVASLSNITSAGQVAALTNTDFVVYNSATDPLVLDLGTPGISFSSVDQGVQFDINSDGAKDQIAWTNGQDGILALDVNGSGKIESGSELFTPDFAGGHFADGIAALASLDANHDAVIDAKDPAFSQLVVWQDANHNGISEVGELTKLGDLGITGINLTTTTGAGPIDGQNVSGIGSFTYTDGSKGSFVEVDLDASLGALSTDHQAEGHGAGSAEAHAIPAAVAASIIADFNHGEGMIDLSSLFHGVPDHHVSESAKPVGAEGVVTLAASFAATPTAITMVHEEAALAVQAAHF